MRRAREQKKSQIARVPSRRRSCFRVCILDSPETWSQQKARRNPRWRARAWFHSRLWILIHPDGIDILHSSHSILFVVFLGRFVPWARVFANLGTCCPDTPLIRQAGSQGSCTPATLAAAADRRSSARPTFQFDTRQNKKNRTSSRVEWNLAG